MDVEHEWHEELPEQCPPSDAIEPIDLVCYRLCEKIPATDGDFLSHRALAPHQVFRAPECIARAISVFGSIDDCADLQKLPIHRHKSIAKVTLGPIAGVIKKTGKARTHYSWWRARGFDPVPSAEAIEAAQ